MKRLTVVLLLIASSAFGQSKVNVTRQTQWVDSVYNKLSVEERIGQLFMVAAYSNKNEAHVQSLEKLVQEQHIGGLIFFQGGPVRQANMTNRLQALSSVPMLVGIDGEWGLNMRLDDTYRFPFNMTLGAVQDLDLIERVGVAMALQTKRLGMQFNFGPVLDININPKNPIIGVRSFGETREIVTERASAFTKGYQSQNIFATGKHFPGHGDTSTDSHHKLPVIDFDKGRLNRVELYPYKKLFEEGLSSVMIAHLNLPAYEPNDIPTSLSYNIVTKLLKEELGFEGLIFTDALNMKAAANYLKPGEVDLAAFKAGNDLLLFSEDVPTALTKILESYNTGDITEERLSHSVKKVLAYKYKSGLTKFTPIEVNKLVEDLNAPVYDDLNQKLYQEAMTVAKNEDRLLPFKNLEKQKIAYMRLGDDSGADFLNMLRNYAEVTELTDVKPDSLGDLSQYSSVIIGYHKVDNPWRKHDMSDAEKAMVRNLSAKTNTVLVSFAKPYALETVPLDKVNALVVGYQNNKFAQEAAAQVIFGAIEGKGKLPVSINKNFTVGTGIHTKAINRLGFSTAANEGMDPNVLSKIDAIAQRAIDKRYTPGIQVLVARHGKVVYQKSFGYHTYDKKTTVQNTDIYDLASLTKILGTLPVLVKMYDEHKVRMDSKLGQLVPAMKHTDKEDITFRDLLTHQSGLTAWIPFYKRTLADNNRPDPSLYSYFYTPEYPTQVSENLYIKKGYTDEMLKQIGESTLSTKKDYKYSDLGFIMMKEFIESKYHKPLDQVADSEYFSKIGAWRMTYNPLRKFDINVIPPTEEDNYYRYTTVQGYVHDMGAAMQGGVSGHAGLFGSALDVAKMMQLYLNKGEYGGDRFFSVNTFDAFNECVYCTKGSRRGVGFDKPQKPGSAGPTCGCASMSSFGHTGFTGTMAWADPEKDLVYVFLSNRTYPDSNVNNLSKGNTREDIQQVIYESIKN
ncbi:glycoside hydrolase family 3 N-terminal domain-containing protein [Myroides marinus]|uniref:beta-N-acetylhexosaminidase n=1 Tax=Myroides marinus TaxID=703342 RepID=A0A1H6UV50_9FLAO|nr:glycoside hydrolase family 3 N-terminal domain-containing protein [Myroides marinus]KUF43558.1 beta-N-acetylglucosaminidase [Myroides marinus]MDM1377783.1 serine hydrolase [Myroides marinus]MDM1385013.1 serine hydrolase [Myroides marinus]MDM1392267.1 serine hydrolase [Myroides marinus]SEI94514.1 beta-glucosidase [Myroides marinus]